MSTVSRRSFLKTCSLAATATGLPLWFLERELDAAAPAESASANERPGIALIGCGGRGTGVARDATRFGNVVAVCDVDAGHAEQAAKTFTKDGKAPRIHHDFREAIAQKDVQVLVNGTPDHWHTLVNLAAALAKKDVYSEKPLTLTIDEGRRLVETVKKTGIILQTGSQQRSDARFRLACELVRGGRIGKVKQAHVWLPAGLHGGPFATKPIPNGLDWDHWLGQAPKVDYVPERCHMSFRYWLDYSGGTMTDWGAHHNDIVRWAVGLAGPVQIEAKVLKEPVPGGYSAPSEYDVSYTYANGVIHRVRSTVDDNPYGGVVKKDGQRNGIRFEGSDGWIWVTRGDLKASNPELLKKPLPEGPERLPVSNDHMGNFFQSVASRKPPICDAETGHRSASVCHLGVLALRLGQPLHWDPEQERFTGDHAKEANALVAREMRKGYDYRLVGLSG